MKEKIINILKILGFWLGIISSVSVIYNCFNSIGVYTVKDFLHNVGEGILFPFVILCEVLPIFIPTIIILYFLFRKFKCSKARIFLISFLIPFTNMVYFFIDALKTGDGIASQMVGFFAIFCVLPMTAVLTIFTPKSLLPIKFDILKTCGLMFVFGWILIFLSWTTVSFADDVYSYYKVRKYDHVIKKLENYKAENGVYPDKLQNIVRIRHVYYKTYDDGQNMVLEIDKYNSKSYKYCSDKEAEECKVGRYEERYQKRIGKWIKSVEDND